LLSFTKQPDVIEPALRLRVARGHVGAKTQCPVPSDRNIYTYRRTAPVERLGWLAPARQLLTLHKNCAGVHRPSLLIYEGLARETSLPQHSHGHIWIWGCRLCQNYFLWWFV